MAPPDRVIREAAVPEVIEEGLAPIILCASAYGDEIGLEILGDEFEDGRKKPSLLNGHRGGLIFWESECRGQLGQRVGR